MGENNGRNRASRLTDYLIPGIGVALLALSGWTLSEVNAHGKAIAAIGENVATIKDDQAAQRTWIAQLAGEVHTVERDVAVVFEHDHIRSSP